MVWWRQGTVRSWRRRRSVQRGMPERPDGTPLRDGDTVLWPGYPRASDVIRAQQAARTLPAWATPTELVYTVYWPAEADLVRPYMNPCHRRPNPHPRPAAPGASR